MKLNNKSIIVLSIIFSLCFQVFAVTNSTVVEESIVNEEGVIIDTKTGFPLILNKPFPVFDYGLTGSTVTRIIKQTDRSNFVFKDTLVGAYVTMQSRNMEPLDSMLRIAFYYPIAYKFNGHPQAAVNMLNFGVDVLAAPFVNLSLWNYVTFDIGAGLHFLYQQGDRWQYANLGLGGIARVNMPIARRWSLFIDGIASMDYGNLGTNSRMEHYDYVWQYQIAIGFRYSRKSPNKYSYIPSKRTFAEELNLLVEKEEEKIQKKVKKEKNRSEKIDSKFEIEKNNTETIHSTEEEMIAKARASVEARVEEVKEDFIENSENSDNNKI